MVLALERYNSGGIVYSVFTFNANLMPMSEAVKGMRFALWLHRYRWQGVQGCRRLGGAPSAGSAAAAGVRPGGGLGCPT